MRYFCGIDLGCKNSQVCVIDEQQTVIFNRKVANKLTMIDGLLSRYKATLAVVVESTANWYWLVDGLQASGYQVKLAHSLKVAAITKAKVKTDKRDALILAQLLRTDMIPESYIYPAKDRPLRDLVRQRWNVVAMRADDYRRLRILLYRNGITDVGSNDVRLLGEEEVRELLDHPLVRRHALLELERIAFYTQQIRCLEKEILALTKTRHDFKNLITIPGIGSVLALTILLEIGDIHRFRDARHFSSYCRIAPGCANSGESEHRSRGSKQGNPYLKWAFTQAAACAIRVDATFRAYFNHYRAKHAGRSGAIITHCIVGHRIALAVYHILKDGVAYDKEKLFRTQTTP